jgi:tetratricopeptide (TPR) repeat protein
MDAINEYLKNLEFSKKHHLEYYYSESLRGLADTYKAIGDRELEKKYATLYLEKQIELNKKPGIAVAFFRLGEINLADSVFDESGRFYTKSFDIYKELKDTGMMAHVMLRIAWVEYLKKNLKESINLFKEALLYSEIAKNPTRITNALGNLGTIYRDLGDDSSALIYYKKSIEISEQVRDYYNLSWVYQDMSSMFVRKGQYEQAYNYYTLYKTFSDSVGTSRYRRGLEQARMLYETERKQQELQILSIRLKQHQYIFYAIAVFVGLLLVIASLVFRQIRVNTRRRIAEMNQKIAEMTQKNLRQQMNPHFIFNTLNSIQYYMYQHDKIATNDYMTKFSQLMRKTLENSQHTAIPIKDELEALNLYLELEALRFKNKFFYTINIDDDIDVVMHKIPTMLIQPYVENAICHGLMNREEPGNLLIDLKLEEKAIACTIVDNGIGREAALKIKNNNSNQHHSLGTTITESRLKLVNSLYGSSMKIEYEDLKSEVGIALGTKVIIHIPILA